MEIVNKIETMMAVLETAKNDATKFEGGNNAAGTRVRKAFKEVMDIAKAGRAEVSEVRNSKTE